jgi:hypothetical protein
MGNFIFRNLSLHMPMRETSDEIASSLYAHLRPEDRERALYNLNRYFEIVLGIFLRRERQAAALRQRRVAALWKILTSCPRLSTLTEQRSNPIQHQ